MIPSIRDDAAADRRFAEWLGDHDHRFVATSDSGRASTTGGVRSLCSVYSKRLRLCLTRRDTNRARTSR